MFGSFIPATPSSAPIDLNDTENSSQALQEANRQRITVFAVMLHAHLLGTGLTLKHIR